MDKLERIEWIRRLDIPKQRKIKELDSLIDELQAIAFSKLLPGLREKWAHEQFVRLNREKNILERGENWTGTVSKNRLYRAVLF